MRTWKQVEQYKGIISLGNYRSTWRWKVIFVSQTNSKRCNLAYSLNFLHFKMMKRCNFFNATKKSIRCTLVATDAGFLTKAGTGQRFWALSQFGLKLLSFSLSRSFTFYSLSSSTKHYLYSALPQPSLKTHRVPWLPSNWALLSTFERCIARQKAPLGN